ncbi:hypothetical protein BH23CHL5_BH23CHL5_15260 [soil metagenome]
MNRPRLGIGTIVGSLRQNSLNRNLFAAMVDGAPPGLDLYEIPIGSLPYFNQDLEN